MNELTVGGLRVSSHRDGERQEIRFTHLGGGPGGMEVIFEASVHGVAVKIWNPARHEWATINDASILYHGDTRT